MGHLVDCRITVLGNLFGLRNVFLLGDLEFKLLLFFSVCNLEFKLLLYFLECNLPIGVSMFYTCGCIGGCGIAYMFMRLVDPG